LALTKTNNFIVVFQFYNTTGCPVQKMLHNFGFIKSGKYFGD